MKEFNDPVNDVKWIHRDNLNANDYNPNKVAPAEMKLLKISILEDGFTQPIVTVQDPDLPEGQLRIVDGFHRYTVSGSTALMKKYEGFVPVVILQKENRTDLQMSTIRHNRARGTHGVQSMSEIMSEMIKRGASMEELMHRLGMEDEEVIRLANKEGIPMTDIIKNSELGKAWIPGEGED